ncbi:MAG: dethiobiotin synthase [Verrucomicrobiales bacterium]|nr:dethiobiotin synthase [Verrucomicrobiales bacterium]
MKGQSFFITGTSTDVGKTHFSCLLLAAMRKAGLSAVGYKPLCCGDRDDAHRLLAASSPLKDGTTLPLDTINPLHFKAAAAPVVAARIENRTFELEPLLQTHHALTQTFDCVVSEGAGGWEVPLTPQKNISDLAVLIDCPIIVVINNQLGALNHTLLTVNAIRQRGLECAGLILNQCQAERDSASISNRVILEEMIEAPILAEILFDQSELDEDFIDQIL